MSEGVDQDQLERIQRRRDLLQCEEVAATYLDGESEEVTVRQLPIRLLETKEFQLNFHLESYLIQATTRLPSGDPVPDEWVDGLTEESHIELVALARELNRPSLLRRNVRTVSWMREVGLLSDDIVSSNGSSMPPEN